MNTTQTMALSNIYAASVIGTGLTGRLAARSYANELLTKAELAYQHHHYTHAIDLAQACVDFCLRSLGESHKICRRAVRTLIEIKTSRTCVVSTTRGEIT